MYYVYLLKSKKDNKFYIGSSSDILRRLNEHNSGKTKSIRHRIPFEVVGFKKFEDKNKARYFEYTVKRNANLRYKFIDEVTSNIDRNTNIDNCAL